jgi:hypothetical protein
VVMLVMFEGNVTGVVKFEGMSNVKLPIISLVITDWLKEGKTTS